MRDARDQQETAVITVPPTVAAPENRSNQSNQSNQDIIKVIGFGGTSVLIGVNVMVNSLTFIAIGGQGASLATTYQSLFFGICGGALMCAGKAIGEPVGKKDFVTASEIAKTAYALTAVMTIASTLGYGAMYFALPSIYALDAAKSASTYLLFSGLGLWPSMALLTTNQIAFQCGDWKSPLISSATYRMLAAGLGYLLAKTANLNEMGLGLGNAIAPWISYVGMELWMRREAFQRLKQGSFSVNTIKKHFSTLLLRALEMSTRGIAEWGNVMAINTTLSRMHSENLIISSPSLQVTSFFILLSQGVGLGTNMILAVNRSKMKNFMQSASAENSDAIKMLQKNIQRTVITGLAIGLMINSLFAITLFLARKPLVNLFIADNASDDARAVAETVFTINAFSLIADTVRIISAILLNTWGKTMQPNAVSLLFMTLIGVPASYLASTKTQNDVVVMYSIRVAMIFLAAMVNLYMLYHAVVGDKKEIDALLQMPGPFEQPRAVAREGCFEKWCNMFRKTQDENAHAIPLLDVTQIRNLNELTVT